MADALVILGTGQKVDNTSLLVAGEPLALRQRLNIASPSIDVGLQEVLPGNPAAGQYGGVVRPIMPFATRSDTFTTAVSGTTVDMSGVPPRSYALQVTPNGAITWWTVVLEASLDNTTFVPVMTHAFDVPGAGAIMWSGGQSFPALYFRARCVAITLGAGTNIVARILGIS